MEETPRQSHNHWDPKRYDQTVGFVPALGAGVLELLAPKPDESILDLGCGTGHLTAKIADMGAQVRGIDRAATMIAAAQRLYPSISFQVADARDFYLDSPVDAVFSNAVLHWIKDARSVARSVARALKPGGRFVGELGGQGNVVTIVDALYAALAEEGISPAQVFNPWYYPSVAEYAGVLEESGFRVALIQTFDRPTPLDDCPEGVADWIRMFAGDFLQSVPAELRAKVTSRATELTRPRLFRDGRWFADYVRVRFEATKKSL